MTGEVISQACFTGDHAACASTVRNGYTGELMGCQCTCQHNDKLMEILGEITQQRREAIARDLLGICPDFTGGLSVDEYMDEQRGRGTE